MYFHRKYIFWFVAYQLGQLETPGNNPPPPPPRLSGYKGITTTSRSSDWATSISLYAPAPRSICIGDLVAHFDRPFESRPVDSVRREVFRQLAANTDSASSSGWIAPSGVLLKSPRPLQPCQEPSTERVPRRRAKK